MTTLSKQTIELSGGKKLLVIKDGGFINARGIRYAEASRFETPRLVGSLKSYSQEAAAAGQGEGQGEGEREGEGEGKGEDGGALDCTIKPPICPQNEFRFAHVVGDLGKGRDEDEDCLFLSVTAPAYAVEQGEGQGQKLPVMVYFHGGAYVAGAGDLDAFSANGLADRGVVVVNVNYRFGVFGYLALEENGSIISPANLGLQDQITSLRWVQENISQFGGDPGQVTLFGQSAGADSIFCILVADGTKGLYHRAILQSAPLGLPHKSEETLKAISEMVLSSLRKEGQDPRLVSVENLLKYQDKVTETAKKFGQGGMAFGPYFGRYPLPPSSELGSRIEKLAREDKIPIMIGWTKHEGRPYLRMIPRLLPWLNIPIFGHLLENVLTWVVTGRVFKWPSQRLHEQLVKASGGEGVGYLTYQFDYHPLNSPFKAGHCMELPFLLGEWEDWKSAPLMLDRRGRTKSESYVDEIYERLAQSVKDFWTSFAKGEDMGGKVHFGIEEGFQFTSISAKKD